MGMNAYMSMNAYTFMPIIGIYAHICIYYVGISYMPIGILPKKTYMSI